MERPFSHVSQELERGEKNFGIFVWTEWAVLAPFVDLELLQLSGSGKNSGPKSLIGSCHEQAIAR